MSSKLPLLDFCRLYFGNKQPGTYPVFYVDKKLVHFSLFCSSVPLYNETSPARNTAAYLLSRLFPDKWRSLFQRAFDGELLNSAAALSVDRYTQSAGVPGWYELCELAALFVAYMVPDASAGTSAAFFKCDLMSAFGVRKRTRLLQHQLNTFAVMIRTALSDADLRQLIVRMRRMAVCTDRQMDKLEARWVQASPADTAWVALAIRQFKIH
jgi:hypothetical protein